ncbi:MAG: hypothetical protein Q7R93_01695 [bacterium]|nr:hypothetical protein [bacterium]
MNPNNPLCLSDHIFTLSVHQLTPDSPLRAILWNGHLTKHDSTVKWSATWSHGNFFRHLEGLAQAVRKELKVRRDIWETIWGLDTPHPCWPINPSTSIENAYMVTDGLEIFSTMIRLSAVAEANGEYSMALSLPNVELTNGEKGRERFSVLHGHRNIFQNIALLRTLAKQMKEERGIEHIHGLDDPEPCWPKGL